MEMFWLIVVGICWLIGTGLTYWEVLEDKDIRGNMAAFYELAGNSFILMALYCIIIAIVCALWPVWKIGDIVMIFSKRGGVSK